MLLKLENIYRKRGEKSILQNLVDKIIEGLDPIIVVDAPPGRGKSTKMMHYMKSRMNGPSPFIYVAVTLDEVERVMNVLNRKDVYTPNDQTRKSSQLFDLISQGMSVVITHQLFKSLSWDYGDFIRKYRYELIIDEVIEPIELIKTPKGIARMLKASNTYSLNEHGRVVWNEEYLEEDVDSESTRRLRALSESRTIKEITNVTGDVIGFMKFHYFQMFHCYQKVHILTYLFNGSKLKGMFQATRIKYKIVSVKEVDGEYELVDSVDHSEWKKEVRKKINLLDSEYDREEGRLLNRGRLYSFNHQDDDELNQKYLDDLSMDIYNIRDNKFNARKHDFIFTFYKKHYKNGRFDASDIESKIEKKREKAGFVSVSTRGTNKYGHIHNAVFACARYANPEIFGYIEREGGIVCENTYAVSDLIQWVWRTAIRNGEPINLAILDRRMRVLFKIWLCTNVFESIETIKISYEDMKRFDSISISSPIWAYVEIEIISGNVA